MKTKFISFAIPLLFGVGLIAISNQTAQAQTPSFFQYPPSPAIQKNPTKWKLVWQDDFRYDGLPNPQKWDYEYGFVRNHEPQFYTKNQTKNAHVKNGVLTIAARKEHIPNPTYRPGNHQPKFLKYTSASITTKGKESWLYGRFEMRAKIPTDSGCWPAFWTLGANINAVHWPLCGEIDILEGFGKPKQLNSGPIWRGGSAAKRISNPPDLSTKFHLYAMEWYPNRIDFFVDDRLVNSVSTVKANEQSQNAFRKPQFIIINLALGVNSGKIDDAKMPEKMVIDYVRVYQLSQPQSAQ